jgi:hypothetical protein
MLLSSPTELLKAGWLVTVVVVEIVISGSDELEIAWTISEEFLGDFELDFDLIPLDNPLELILALTLLVGVEFKACAETSESVLGAKSERNSSNKPRECDLLLDPLGISKEGVDERDLFVSNFICRRCCCWRY